MKQALCEKYQAFFRIAILSIIFISSTYSYAQSSLGRERQGSQKELPMVPGLQPWLFIILGLFTGSMITYLVIRLRQKKVHSRESGKRAVQDVINDSLQYQLETEQVINYFASSMVGKLTVDDVLWDIASNCISKLNFEDCIIYLKDEERNVLVQKAAWGPKTTQENKIVNPIEIPLGKGIVGAVARSGKAEIIADTRADHRYIVDDMHRQSEIAVPIIGSGKVIGIIDSEHSKQNFYTQRHLQILTTIASLCADKIEIARSEHQVREREIELIRLNRDMATYQLTALRAQMSPHFIFNAINSIQQYILCGDVDEANRYLSKFSRLQRDVLNHCDQPFITLEAEIGMLELYLQLEKLRFNDNFESHIFTEEGVDCSEIKIPPMMLQPFIENAIWHGLMPKAAHRRVDVRFSLQTDELLTCTISDNGIGRSAAAALKQNAGVSGSHKSKGLPLVYERMKILQQQYGQPFQAIISDVLDSMGNTKGTQVILTLYIGDKMLQD